MTYTSLQKTLGITFKDVQLLKRAFVHRSHLNESKDFTVSNERLEFLGDAILSFLTSHYLFLKYPDLPEGTLTNIRSALVKTRSLSTIAEKLSLGDLLMLSRGEEESGGRSNTSLLADAFEALLGAVLLDQGLDAVRHVLELFLFPQAEEIVKQKSYIDFKSLFQEIVQQDTRVSPVYRVVKSEGPDHAKTFWIEALIGDTPMGTGVGKSKQEAEQEAARDALEKLRKT